MNPTADPVQSAPNIQPDQNPAPILAPIPVVSGSGMHKEEGPVISFASAPETVPVVDNQLKEAGVEAPVQHNNPSLTVEDKQVGISLSPAAQPAPVRLSENSFAMTQAQAKIEQKGSVVNSSSWLAALWSKFFTSRPKLAEGEAI